MQTSLTQEEQKLITYAKEVIVKHNTERHAKGEIDTLYSFVLSDSGKIFEGAAFEVDDLEHASICAERQAIANMVLAETYKAKIKSIVVADPVPELQKNGTTPCGTCRSVIWEFGTPDTTVLSIQYIQREKNSARPKIEKHTWDFLSIEKHTIKELYPEAFEPVEWGGPKK